MAPTPFHDPSPEIIASWPSPDLVNPPNRGPALLIIVSALIFFSLLSLALRIYSRVFFRRNFGLDDLLILPAAVLFLCVGAITVVGNTQYGWGMHAWDVPIELREHGFLLAWVYEILVTWCLMLTKLSLCVFYLRLLGGAGSERSRALIFSLMAVIMLWGLVFTIAIVMQCTPISGVYRINMPGKRCLSRQGGLAAHTSVDIITDLAIYFMPIRKMYHLRVPRRQKMMLVGIFSLGAIVCMASIFRIPATIRSMGSYDVTWHMWVSLIWTDLETGIGIVVACLPSLTPILIRFMGRHEPKEVQKNYVNRPGTRFKNTMARAFPNHIYPQAQITTTVTATARENWYGWESEEETIRRVPNHGHEDEESGGDDAGEKLETGVMLVETTRSITRTTVIEQTVSECCGSSKAGVPYTRS